MFGEGLRFCSLFANADSGPWAVANFALETDQSSPNESAAADNTNGQDSLLSLTRPRPTKST